MPSSGFVQCVVFGCMLLLLAPLSQGFVVQLAANEEACFYEDLAVGDRMGVTFEVGVGGRLDIDFRITAPNGLVLHEGQRERSNTYTFQSEEAGRHTFCFSNQMSVRAQKTVTFTVATVDNNNNNNNNNNQQTTPTTTQQGTRSLFFPMKRRREMD